MATDQSRLGQFPLPALDTGRPPWPGQYRRIGGVDLYLRRTPSGGMDGASSEPAVYVHGLGGASTNFTDLANLLAPWFDGVAIDLPGFGRSGPPAGADYSLDSHTATVVDYLEASDRGAVHLVGNSMGGSICIAIAAQRPELVRTLTLISPAVPDLRMHRQDVVMPLVMLPGLGPALMRRLDKMTPERRARATIELCFARPDLVPPNRLHEAMEDVTERRQQAWSHDAMVSSLRGLVRTYLRRGPRAPWSQLARIVAPTAVIWGTADRLVDVGNAPRVAATLRDAELLILDEVGHTAQLEDPINTARMILTLRQRANQRSAEDGVGF
ncbi:MAG: alpha/beta hydrolase [Frankiales bacterium]|nr:alpha/beta hydrolase [Frankiales bacterium]